MNKSQIIKEYEKSAGYMVCYYCCKAIQRGRRVLLTREFRTKGYPLIRNKVIGAVCIGCFNKLDGEIRTSHSEENK